MRETLRPQSGHGASFGLAFLKLATAATPITLGTPRHRRPKTRNNVLGGQPIDVVSSVWPSGVYPTPPRGSSDHTQGGRGDPAAAAACAHRPVRGSQGGTKNGRPMACRRQAAGSAEMGVSPCTGWRGVTPPLCGADPGPFGLPLGRWDRRPSTGLSGRGLPPRPEPRGGAAPQPRSAAWRDPRVPTYQSVCRSTDRISGPSSPPGCRVQGIGRCRRAPVVEAIATRHCATSAGFLVILCRSRVAAVPRSVFIDGRTPRTWPRLTGWSAPRQSARDWAACTRSAGRGSSLRAGLEDRSSDAGALPVVPAAAERARL